MLNLSDFTQFGVPGIAIVSTVVIVTAILKSMKEKDIQFLSFMARQEESFNKVITNHLDHSTQATNNLDKTMSNFMSFLKDSKK